MILSEGQILFIEEHRDEDVNKLALQKSPLSREEMLFALMQIDARQRLKEKLPTILGKREFVFPTRISTEQASSEVTAELKKELVESLKNLGESMVSADLTGGLGVDSIFMAKGSKRHHYVELNPEHSKAAEVNLPLFLDNVVVHNMDAEKFLNETNERFDFVYADPSRRSESNSKVFRLEDCVPNILELKPLIMSKSRWLIVKLSPMLDITQAIEKMGAERVIAVSVNDECKELIVVCGKGEKKDCRIEAIEINRRGKWRENIEDSIENPGSLYGMPEAGMMIYEPYAAMMKIGHYEELAVKYGMKMVAPSSHLFFCKEKCGFPGREFIVKEVCTFTKNSIKGIKKANITVRNFPMSVAEVRKRFRIEDGGEIYLFLTTDNNGEKLIIRCEKSR